MYRVFVVAIICGLVVAENDDPKYYGDPDGLVFPGPAMHESGKSRVRVQPVKLGGSNSDLAKSLQLAKKISSIASVDEFLKLFPGVSNEERFSIGGRIGDTGERSNAEVPSPAGCAPELQTVPLNKDADPSTMYFPSCTRVKRCGGCCNHLLLSCQPAAVEIRNFQVLVMSIGQSPIMTDTNKRIVPVEEHTKCHCDCKIKKEHCSEKQSYIPAECRCMCNNVDEEEKCKNNETKEWNPETCTCSCREKQECSTGWYFDQNTCRCERDK